MTEERDPMIERFAEELRSLPLVNPEAKARLLVAVAAVRERDREAQHQVGLSRGRRWLARGAGLAAAAVVLTLALRQPTPTQTNPSVARDSTPMAASPATASQLVSATAVDAALQPVQFVFRSAAASRVRVVGDFNAWDATRAPMTRDTGSGLWSVNIALRPGRHVYAFVVDDTLWVRDPRAPAAADADFGRPGSVLLVGRP